MSKTKTSFFCQHCGAQFPKWVGKCTSCNEWNTIVEEVIEKSSPHLSESFQIDKKTPSSVSEIELETEDRILIPDKELERVLGGGIVPGSLILLGGEPGIGKSTLLLQLALKLKGHRVLYVSGEESSRQIKMRAHRLGFDNPDCYIYTETSTQQIIQQLLKLKPHVVIIDSIQTLFTSRIESSPGSVSQIRESTSELIRYAKETSTPIFIIGHITKDGNIAGPKILEHMVDTVLQFEGDRHHIYRIIRSVKNRFGSTSELGIYEMQGDGLREVSNPSEILISQREEPLSGISVSATIEGLRPMLIETQALVSTAVYGTPQRSTTGYDLRRLNMMLAVLEKRCGFRLASKDVFLNIAGGLKVEDPAIDLAVICSILSSGEDIPIPAKYCFAGEVGLSGEIRPVNRVEQRISEAEKLGFEKFFLSKYNMKGIDRKKFGIEIVSISKVEEAFSQLFG